MTLAEEAVEGIRRQALAEDEIRIGLNGLRGTDSIAELWLEPNPIHFDRIGL